MIEALVRIRNDSVLSRPGRKLAAGGGMLRRAAERARSLPPRFYVGAAVSAVLVGIGVNALVLQRERHPAPLFAPAPQKPAISAPAEPAAAAPAHETQAAAPARETQAAAPLPPARAASSDAPPARPSDAIGDLLRADPAADASRLVVTAQTALVKLGYPVKADGTRGAATDQALREFERDHGLPVSTDITPRLVKLLNAAARTPAH